MTVTFHDAPDLPPWLADALPFRRRLAQIDGKAIHFIDEGEGPAVLLVHGNPTWCFLWRKVIAQLLPGARVLAPDLLGFGLSDKPRRPEEHTLTMHIDVVARLLDALDPGPVVLVGQDWGGPVATGVGSRRTDGVAGMVLANTAVLRPARPFRSKPFHRFSHAPIVSDLAFRGLGFPLPVLDRVQGDRRSIGPLEKRAYRYPLRRLADRAGPLGLARMVPDSERHPSTAVMDEVGAWVEGFRGPVELVWGLRDPILGRALGRHARALPQARVTETEAGHFLQEEVPDLLAAAVTRITRGA